MASVTRIVDNSRSLGGKCKCGDMAAYIVDGLLLCGAAAAVAKSGAVPPLPDGVRVVWSLDQVGEESARDDVAMPARYTVAASCQTVYRILPGTEDAGHGWVSPFVAANHGYTMAGVLVRIREMFAQSWNADAIRRVRLVVVRNYGYSFILEG